MPPEASTRSSLGADAGACFNRDIPNSIAQYRRGRCGISGSPACGTRSELIERAPHAPPALIEHVRVNHRRAHIPMPSSSRIVRMSCPASSTCVAKLCLLCRAAGDSLQIPVRVVDMHVAPSTQHRSSPTHDQRPATNDQRPTTHDRALPGRLPSTGSGQESRPLRPGG